MENLLNMRRTGFVRVAAVEPGVFDSAVWFDAYGRPGLHVWNGTPRPDSLGRHLFDRTARDMMGNPVATIDLFGRFHF